MCYKNGANGFEMWFIWLHFEWKMFCSLVNNM